VDKNPSSTALRFVQGQKGQERWELYGEKRRQNDCV
jgi:hypothetical protein